MDIDPVPKAYDPVPEPRAQRESSNSSYSSRPPASKPNDEDYRLPRRENSSRYPAARDPRKNYAAKAEEPTDEYVPSTIDKYLKSNMSKDEVLEKLKADLFKSNESPQKRPPPVNNYPPPNPVYARSPSPKRIYVPAPSPPIPSGRIFGESRDAPPPPAPAPVSLPDIDYSKLLPTIPPELQLAVSNMPAHLPPELAAAVRIEPQAPLPASLQPYGQPLGGYPPRGGVNSFQPRGRGGPDIPHRGDSRGRGRGGFQEDRGFPNNRGFQDNRGGFRGRGGGRGFQNNRGGGFRGGPRGNRGGGSNRGFRT